MMYNICFDTNANNACINELLFNLNFGSIILTWKNMLVLLYLHLDIMLEINNGPNHLLWDQCLPAYEIMDTVLEYIVKCFTINLNAIMSK